MVTCRLKRSRTGKGATGRLQPSRSIVGNLKKSFSQSYNKMDDDLDRDPLVSSNNSRSFQEDELVEVFQSSSLPPPPFSTFSSLISKSAMQANIKCAHFG